MDRVAALFDWLVDGAPGANDPAAVVARLAADLVAAGIPLDRVAAFVTTLHPNAVGRGFFWKPGEDVRVDALTYEMQQSPIFQESPVHDVFVSGKELRATPAADSRYEVIVTLHREGFTDFFALPMRFIGGGIHAITFATRRPGGFTETDVTALRHVVRPLARVGEILALRRTAVNLLSTYVGPGTGERILAGRIRRGDIDTIRATIWFSDLRGFTAMSSGASPREIIDALNELFEHQVPAIEQRGGEVLKFIGDGLLAIFPCEGPEATRRACDAAIDAADAALAALAAAPRALRIGVGLHVGEIAYGNIGGPSRLDFTAIGSAVNLASRIEGLTGKVGRAIAVSSEVARHTSRPLEDLGEFEVKGVTGPVRIHAPASPVRA